MELREVALPDLPFDAALFPRRDGRYRILVNLKIRNAARRRFSVAHEIAHTLLPDPRETAHYRLQTGQDAHAEIERLADLGAALLLMPPDQFSADLRDHGLCLTTLTVLRDVYQTSLEATALNVVRHSESPCAICFCGFDYRPKVEANPLLFEDGKDEKRWRIRKSYHSKRFPLFLYRGRAWPEQSIVARAASSGAEVCGEETLYFGGYKSEVVQISAKPLHCSPPEPPSMLTLIQLIH